MTFHSKHGVNYCLINIFLFSFCITLSNVVYDTLGPWITSSNLLVNVGVLKPIKYKGVKLYVCPNAEEAILILDDDETL